ncbi:MAG: N-acetyl-gamma-glutamyl-phosphate reductase [Candidatus Melainabacteria bacterium]|nr:N-acetyl-gamma-glutamyl-phosphate reductase [Candidatus Melainabacteria bacterium]MBI3308238.1 N-acetyl-gamma-glutamyl-phosphate reductase [Candidatus Melainabacteria bacterium]
MKFKIGIIGATGYTGAELIKLLLNHPGVEITAVTSEQHAGKKYYEIYPSFYDRLKLKLKKTNANELAKKCDLIFLATPNDFAKHFIPQLLRKNKSIKLIDLSSDFRLAKTVNANNKKYDTAYGLPEINRKEVRTSQIIANPGCYPTSIILALAPLLRKNIIDVESIIIDSKSGVSGAGKGPKQDLHFVEINESFTPYKLGGTHRHIPEIENELSKLLTVKKKSNLKIVFSPHLLPINRGIISTIYVSLKRNKRKKSQNEITKLYKTFYKNEYFIKILPPNIYPQIKNVRNSNFCHITPLVDKRTNKLIIVSAIDNMVKGASGQAIQNMNIILSLDEKLGLDTTSNIP